MELHWMLFFVVAVAVVNLHVQNIRWKIVAHFSIAVQFSNVYIWAMNFYEFKMCHEYASVGVIRPRIWSGCLFFALLHVMFLRIWIHFVWCDDVIMCSHVAFLWNRWVERCMLASNLRNGILNEFRSFIRGKIMRMNLGASSILFIYSFWFGICSFKIRFRKKGVKWILIQGSKNSFHIFSINFSQLFTLNM